MMKALPLIFILLVASVAYAHQPYLLTAGSGTEADPYIINDPSVSKVMYGQISGSPVYYKFSSAEPFPLYVQILAPYANGYDANSNRMSIYISTDSRMEVAYINEANYFWSSYYEEYGNDYYFTGPEIRRNLTNGTYVIRIFNTANAGKYALAIGEEEVFTPGDMINALVQVPLIKQQIFGRQIAERFLELIGLLLVTAGLVSLYAAAKLSKTRETNHVIVHFYNSMKYVIWAGLIILTASWCYVFSQNTHNIFGIIETFLLAALILKWSVFFILNNSKFRKLREKNALVAPKFLRSVTLRLTTSLVLLLLLVMAMVIA